MQISKEALQDNDTPDDSLTEEDLKVCLFLIQSYLTFGFLVVSIGLFWFYFVSFSYNGVYFLRFIFSCTLAQYLSALSF